jgi:hypothetical protein
MYTLTEISIDQDNVVYNQGLGESFSIIERENSPSKFETAYNAFYNKPDDKMFTLENINPNIHCIVATEGGKKLICLTKSNYYYIVTDSGKTFKNLTFK